MVSRDIQTDEVFRFTAKYFADQGEGRRRTLREYLDLFPAFPARIESAFAELDSDSSQTTSAAARTVSSHETIGPYRVLEELGRGGQGVVYLAEDTRLQRNVALKVLRGFGGESAAMRARLAREAEAASKLDDPVICTVYEVGEADGQPFLAMRYIDGDTLAASIDAQREVVAGKGSDDSTSTGPGTRDELVRCVEQIERVARSLHAAHEIGLIHRDIKPGNIMLTAERDPVLLDFGLVHDESSEGDTLTRTGDVLGTPAYMSPEQVNGERVDRRSDVYSLGATLYEYLTLRRPFEAPTREQLYRRILTSNATAAFRLNPRVPRDLWIVIETALEKDRDRRYQTALDLADDLERFRTFQTIHARPTPLPLRVRRWVQRNRAATAILALVTVSLVLSLWLLRRTEEALRQQRISGIVAASARVMELDPMEALRLSYRAAHEEASPETVSQLHRMMAMQQPRAIMRCREGRRWSKIRVAESSGRIVAFPGSPRIDPRPFLSLFEATGEEVVTMEFDDDSAIHQVEISPAGDRVVVQLMGRTRSRGVQFRDEADRLLREIPDGTCVVANADGVLVFGWDGKESRVTQHDWDGKTLGEHEGTPSPVYLAKLRDGHYVLVCENGRVELRDAKLKSIMTSSEMVRTEKGLLTALKRLGGGGEPREWPGDGDYCAKTGVVVASLESGENRVGRVFISRRSGDSRDSRIVPSMEGFFALSRRGDRLLTAEPPTELGHVTGTVRLHDIDMQFEPRPIKRSGRPTNLVVEWHDVSPFGFAPSGDRFFTSHSNGSVVVWSADGELIREIRGRGKAAVCFGPKADELLVGRMAATKLYDAEGDEVLKLRTPHQLQNTPVFVAGGKSIVTVCSSIYRFDLHDEVLPVYREHGGPVHYVAVSVQGAVATGTVSEGVCRIWRTPGSEPEVLKQLSGFPHPYLRRFVEFHPDGGVLLTGSENVMDPAPRLRDLTKNGDVTTLSAAGIPPRNQDPQTTAIWDAAFSRDGDRIVLGCGDHGVVLSWDPSVEDAKWTFVGRSQGSRTGFAYGIDIRGDLILTASKDGICRLYDVNGDGKPIKTFDTGTDVGANAAHFLPDGERFVVAYNNEDVRIWRLDGAAVPDVIPDVRAFQLRVSPNEDRIACVAKDAARILDLDGNVLAVLRGHRDDVTCLRFTHDGRKLLTGSADRTVRTWFVYAEDLIAHTNRRLIHERPDSESAQNR